MSSQPIAPTFLSLNLNRQGHRLGHRLPFTAGIGRDEQGRPYLAIRGRDGRIFGFGPDGIMEGEGFSRPDSPEAFRANVHSVLQDQDFLRRLYGQPGADTTFLQSTVSDIQRVVSRQTNDDLWTARMGGPNADPNLCYC